MFSDELKKQFEEIAAGAEVPSHVPKHLVTNFNLYLSSEMGENPHDVMAGFHEGTRVFYNACDHNLRGCWYLTKMEDIKWALRNPAIFSSRGNAGISQLVGEGWDLIPLEIDGQMHKKYRDLIGPLFAPEEIEKLKEKVNFGAEERVASIANRTECEFVSEFSKPFPVRIMLDFLGLPLDSFGQFMEWEESLLHNPDLLIKVEAAQNILDYIRELISQRRAENTDDFMTMLVNSEVDGRALTDDEIVGIFYLLFVAGLDTVTASLGFFFKYLAENYEAQMELRENRELIPKAIEELYRRFAVVCNNRKVVQDVELGGVLMKEGDWVVILTPAANLDPDAFENPLEVDFSRSPNHHVAFNFGVHRCLGSHLARREIQAAFEAWFDKIPPFRVKPNTNPVTRGGNVFGVDELQLVWG